MRAAQGAFGGAQAVKGAQRELASPRREGPDGVMVGRPLSASWAARVWLLESRDHISRDPGLQD